MEVQRQEMQISMLQKHESGFHEHADTLGTLSARRVQS